MKHLPYFYPDQCPLTDEDREIARAIASRIGSAWWAIHQTEAGMSARRDEMASRHYADTRSGKHSVRRDLYGRLVPPARCMS
jgi:hypothetical protein